jgi:hypothetical protein
MGNRYVAILFFLLIGFSASAQIRMMPATTNPVLSRASYEEEAAQAAEVEAFTGRPMEEPGTTFRGPCPSFDDGTNYLFPGDTIAIFVDTTFLNGGVGATITLVECDPVDAGVANLDTTSLRYIANTGIDSGTDTLCVEFCPTEGDCFNFIYPVVVKRPGTSYQLAEVELNAGEFLPELCVDETVLPGALQCNRIIDCGDLYAGEGQQVAYFTTYQEPVGCIRYKAGQFAGLDEVCVVLCDEFTVCDTFLIPFRIVSDTLSLPFFDDFSYAGPYPDFEYWLDRNVFVNNTMAANPPSVGMATFDGLNRRGGVYPTQFGTADRLTSKYIDLSNPSGEVVLKFYLAPKGFGLYPNGTDSLFVEFRDQSGDWIKTAAFGGIEGDIPLDSVPAFNFVSVKVDDPAFLYDGFQFRFTNLVSPGGLFDLWHLDYVYLNDNEDESANFEDLAFMIPPSNLLENYTSMPWSHFEDFVADEFAGTTFESGFYNHFDQTVSITESAIRLRETTTDFSFTGAENVVDGVDANFLSQKPELREKVIDGLITAGYEDDLESQFSGAEEVQLELLYEFDQDSQDPLFLRNDTVRSYTIFDNYFAYDDGSAESYLYFENPQGVNPSMAVRFRSNIEDSLRAIQFHFPHVNGNVSNQLFNMQVWVGSLEGDPAFEAIFLNPVYPDTKFDTLQGYTTYRLQNILGELTPVYLPAQTDFYVSFQQATVINDGIPLGFDLNNQNEQEIWIDLGPGWSPLTIEAPAFKGSVMIRPVVGDFTPPNTPVTEVLPDLTEQVVLYPNPTTGFVRISGLEDPQDWNYRLLDGMGRTLQQGRVESELQFSNFVPGSYFLQMIHPEEGHLLTKRLVILR